MQEPTRPSEPSKPIRVDLAPFPVIPGYRFQKRLGSGGMATVYLATQESLDRPVAIKVTDHDALRDEISKQRFENEARTIARLDHSGIVGIHEVGRTADGLMYYVMPYLANGDLAQRELRNDEARIIELLRTLLAALGYAHAHGIVHRDVKAENVLFDLHDRPRLTDFGIAISKRDTSRLTQAGLSVGSSGYMAPEQARGEQVDGRADLYSVGVLAFALLAGHLPFRASEPLALALMHAQDPIPRLPPEQRRWQSFIDRAMAKLPDNRYNSAEQMLQALDRIQRKARPELRARLTDAMAQASAAVGGKKRLGLLTTAVLLLLVAGSYAANEWSSKKTTAIVPASANQHPVTAQPLPPPAQPPTTAPPVEAKPASKPAQTPATKKTTKPASTRRRPAKKKKSWFSRVFRRH